MYMVVHFTNQRVGWRRSIVPQTRGLIHQFGVLRVKSLDGEGRLSYKQGVSYTNLVFYQSDCWREKVPCPTNRESHPPIWCITSQIVEWRRSLVPQTRGLVHQFGVFLVDDPKIRLLLLGHPIRFGYGWMRTKPQAIPRALSHKKLYI